MSVVSRDIPDFSVGRSARVVKKVKEIPREEDDDVKGSLHIVSCETIQDYL